MRAVREVRAEGGPHHSSNSASSLETPSLLALSFMACPWPPLPVPPLVLRSGAAPSPACRPPAGRRGPAAAAAPPAAGLLLPLGDVGLLRAGGGEPGAASIASHPSSSPQPSPLACLAAAAAAAAGGGAGAAAAGREAAGAAVAAGLERETAARLPPMPSLDSRCRASSSATTSVKWGGRAMVGGEEPRSEQAAASTAQRTFGRMAHVQLVERTHKARQAETAQPLARRIHV